MSHKALDYFTVKNDQLFVAEKNIGQIINMTGESPLYIYDRAAITQRVNHLRRVLPNSISLHYAIKANPMSAVVQHLSSLVDGFDITSQGELLTALNSGMSPSEISFAGPAKSTIELTAAISSGITLHVESENELDRIVALAEKLAICPHIAFRVNPEFELQASGMKMSGGPKQFGIDEEQIPALLQKIKSYNITFKGLHIFTGSQNLSSDAIIDAHNKTFELANRLLSEAAIDFQSVNIGGGFGIPYFKSQEALQIEPIADNLNRLLEQDNCLKKKEIIIELGRYLVGEAGLYACQIIDKKISRGKTFLICNGGLHHHLANSGNLGQVIRRNYPVILSKKIATSQDDIDMETVTIVGPLCTPLDTIADKISLPHTEIGDFIVVLQSGAYGKTASPENFLSHNPVKEILL